MPIGIALLGLALLPLAVVMEPDKYFWKQGGNQ